MKVIKTKVYTFDELNDKAKEKALQWWYESFGYPWGDEAIETIKKFVALFNGKVKNYSIDYQNASRSSVGIQWPDGMIEDMPGIRAYKWIVNNKIPISGDCPLTGVCFDEHALDSVRDFLKNPKGETIREIVEDGIKNVLKAVEKDFEHQAYGEGAIESILANEYTFTENGERF